MSPLKSHRRKFIKKSILAALSATVGMDIVFGNNLMPGASIVAKNPPIDFYQLPEKHEDMIILNDRPVNAETPAHLLHDDITPNDLFFVRNNGIPPENPDSNTWTLTVEGESAKQKKTYTLQDLKSKFSSHTLYLTLECGGNGRKEFNPPASGNQWSVGAVGCAAWTGIKLKDLLLDVGIKEDAVYLGYYGKDTHLSGDPSKEPISRGVPIEKALAEESMIAWEMNEKPLPLLNGYPLRLVFGGYPASCSGKWLEKIVIRNQVHDGTKMTGKSYRIPCKPVAPGTKVADEDMCIIEKMPVKSLITYPKTGAIIPMDQKLPIQGHAWTGNQKISKMEYSIDFGATWNTCQLGVQKNRFAWQNFSAQVDFPQQGYYEVWARATDNEGIAQPMLLPGWNPKGYLNNACHRIAIKVVKQ